MDCLRGNNVLDGLYKKRFVKALLVYIMCLYAVCTPYNPVPVNNAKDLSVSIRV